MIKLLSDLLRFDDTSLWIYQLMFEIYYTFIISYFTIINRVRNLSASIISLLLQIKLNFLIQLPLQYQIFTILNFGRLVFELRCYFDHILFIILNVYFQKFTTFRNTLTKTFLRILCYCIYCVHISIQSLRQSFFRNLHLSWLLISFKVCPRF